MKPLMPIHNLYLYVLKSAELWTIFRFKDIAVWKLIAKSIKTVWSHFSLYCTVGVLPYSFEASFPGVTQFWSPQQSDHRPYFCSRAWDCPWWTFRPGRGCFDQNFAIQQLIEERLKKTDNYLHCLQISIWLGQLTSPVKDIGSRTCATKNRYITLHYTMAWLVSESGMK